MKRALVAVIGSLLALTGVALLVLPGPGFVLVAAGLGILATEFAWARKPLRYAKKKAEEGVKGVGRSRWRAALAGLFAVGLAAVGVLEIAGVDLPFVTDVTAVLLILSGLFLVGTVVCARILGKRRAAGPGKPAGPTRPAGCRLPAGAPTDPSAWPPSQSRR